MDQDINFIYTKQGLRLSESRINANHSSNCRDTAYVDGNLNLWEKLIGTKQNKTGWQYSSIQVCTFMACIWTEPDGTDVIPSWPSRRRKFSTPHCRSFTSTPSTLNVVTATTSTSVRSTRNRAVPIWPIFSRYCWGRHVTRTTGSWEVSPCSVTPSSSSLARPILVCRLKTDANQLILFWLVCWILQLVCLLVLIS